jgi:hypothetical protein
VVANWVFTRLPMIPWRPRLAEMKPRAVYAPAFDHTMSPRLSLMLASPDRQIASAAPIVKSAWMIVPRKSHPRVFAPMRSPIRPRNAPPRNVNTEVSARRSGMWKEPSRPSGWFWNVRARAMASCWAVSYTQRRKELVTTTVPAPCCRSGNRAIRI